MNAKKCKMLRKAAGFGLVEYDRPEMHHVAGMPHWRTYERTVREMGPVSPGAPTNTRHGIPRAGERRCVVTKTVTSILRSGKAPVAVMEPHKDPETGAVTMRQSVMPYPVSKPIRLKKGSPRAVYQDMKRMEAHEGIDKVFAQLLAESTAFDSPPVPA